MSEDKAKKIVPLIRRLAGDKYYEQRVGRFVHFYTKSVHFWKIRNCDIRQLKKYDKELTKKELLLEKERIEKLLMT